MCNGFVGLVQSSLQWVNCFHQFLQLLSLLILHIMNLRSIFLFHSLYLLWCHSRVELFIALIPLCFESQVIFLSILEFLFPHGFTFFQLFLIYLLDFSQALNAQFLALNCILVQILLGFSLQVLDLSQKLVFIDSEVIETSVMFNLHKLDFLFILKTNVINFVFKQFILLNITSVVWGIAHLVILKQALKFLVLLNDIVNVQLWIMRILIL